MTSNFDFLSAEFPELAKWGRSAESKMYDEPVDAIKDMGLMCEKAVILICDYYEIEVDKRIGPARARIDTLKKNEIISKEQANTLHAIRIKRNDASHDGEGSTGDCMDLFPKAYKFALWFANTFGKTDYVIRQYEIPEPSVSKARDVYVVEPATNENDVELAKIQDKKDKRKTIAKGIAWFFGVWLVLAIIITVGIGIMDYLEEKGVDNKSNELSNTITEIESLIEKGEFDRAEKAIDKTWPYWEVPVESNKDEEPMKLLVEIEEGRAKKANATVPTCSVPRSSKSFKGDNYRDVAKELQDAGFIQIYAKQADADSSLIHRKNTIMRVSIAGDSDFDEGDQYSETAKITIYYYY